MKRKKRIAYVLRRFPVLSETFILNEILAIERLGTRVEIYSTLQPRDPRFHEGLARLKANIRYLPDIFDLKSLARYNAKARRTFGPKYTRLLLKCILSFRPKLIWRFFQAGYVAQRAHERRIEHMHAHFANRATTIARLAHKLSGISFSFTAHAVDIYKDTVSKRVLARKIEDAKFVITVSDENKQYLDQIAPRSADVIVRLYNGIDLKHFSCGPARCNNLFTVLSVGRLIEKKGLDILIQACANLRDEDFDFCCLIVGKGRGRSKLVSLIEKLDLKDCVRLLSSHTQNEIVERYREADLFALPCIIGSDGNRDGLPVSIVEALACGVPVVSTYVTGIPEVVENERNGLLVAPENVKEFTNAMRRIMSDRDFHREIRANARATVLQKFDSEKTSATLRDYLTLADAIPNHRSGNKISPTPQSNRP